MPFRDHNILDTDYWGKFFWGFWGGFFVVDPLMPSKQLTMYFPDNIPVECVIPMVMVLVTGIEHREPAPDPIRSL